MRSLISLRAKGISGPEKFWASPQKDFCNTINLRADTELGVLAFDMRHMT